MLGFITFGRVLFAVLFIYTGATKLFAIQATADIIAAKVTVPSALATYTAQLESLTSMKRAGCNLILTYHAREAARWLA